MDPKHVTELERYFRAHGMRSQLRALWRWRSGQGDWPDEHVAEWMSAIGVGPGAFPEIAHDAPCPCGAELKWRYTQWSLPDRHTVRCQLCGARAVVRDN